MTLLKFSENNKMSKCLQFCVLEWVCERRVNGGLESCRVQPVESRLSLHTDPMGAVWSHPSNSASVWSLVFVLNLCSLNPNETSAGSVCVLLPTSCFICAFMSCWFQPHTAQDWWNWWNWWNWEQRRWWGEDTCSWIILILFSDELLWKEAVNISPQIFFPFSSLDWLYFPENCTF